MQRTSAPPLADRRGSPLLGLLDYGEVRLPRRILLRCCHLLLLNALLHPLRFFWAATTTAVRLDELSELHILGRGTVEARVCLEQWLFELHETLRRSRQEVDKRFSRPIIWAVQKEVLQPVLQLIRFVAH